MFSSLVDKDSELSNLEKFEFLKSILQRIPRKILQMSTLRFTTFTGLAA